MDKHQPVSIYDIRWPWPLNEARGCFVEVKGDSCAVQDVHLQDRKGKGRKEHNQARVAPEEDAAARDQWIKRSNTHAEIDILLASSVVMGRRVHSIGRR